MCWHPESLPSEFECAFLCVCVCFKFFLYVCDFFIKNVCRIQTLVHCKLGQVNPKAYFSHLKVGT